MTLSPENWIKLIEVIVWPVVTVSIFFILRNKIPLIIRFIEKIKFKDLEISLSKEISKDIKIIEETTNSLIIEPSDTKKKLIDKELYLIAAESPREAIMKSWEMLGKLACEVVQGYLDPEDGEVDTLSPSFVRWALGTKFISKVEHLRIYDELKSVVDKLNRTDFMEPSESESLSFISAANKISIYLEMKKKITRK